jgi:hypothetical protein
MEGTGDGGQETGDRGREAGEEAADGEEGADATGFFDRMSRCAGAFAGFTGLLWGVSTGTTGGEATDCAEGAVGQETGDWGQGTGGKAAEGAETAAECSTWNIPGLSGGGAAVPTACREGMDAGGFCSTWNISGPGRAPSAVRRRFFRAIKGGGSSPCTILTLSQSIE